MPIYEYRCESCGTELEKIQKFSDPPLTDCPACGKAALKKLVSASSFRLKGSGWYETDFKNKPGDSGGSKTSKSSTTSGNASDNSTADNKSADSGKTATEKSSESGKKEQSSPKNAD